MFKETVTIQNKTGLHARPASLFVEKVKCFSSEVYVAFPGNEPVSGKRILGILTLAAEKGDTIEISAEGTDAEAAVTELVNLINSFNPNF